MVIYLPVGDRVIGSQVDGIDDIPSAPKVSTVSTAELPGGVPEEQMKDAKGHRLGHVQSVNRTINS